jgi:AraC family transcriptional regulator, regulatory protein of adaptative response / methylated-DNA-[protein]-cysteine methyltransferase
MPRPKADIGLGRERDTTMDAMIESPTVRTLRFSFGMTRLGHVLVACSDRGVAAILLGDDRSHLRRALAGTSPDAQLTEDEAGLAQTVEKVVALIDAPHREPAFPLDLRGSDLELAVWHALRRIPSGETRTYGEVAKELAVPATARDVAAACAANVLAVAIPCHRVVKADGSLSGYRWGTQRKRRLINMEGVA